MGTGGRGVGTDGRAGIGSRLTVPGKWGGTSGGAEGKLLTQEGLLPAARPASAVGCLLHITATNAGAFQKSCRMKEIKKMRPAGALCCMHLLESNVCPVEETSCPEAIEENGRTLTGPAKREIMNKMRWLKCDLQGWM